MAIQFSCTHCGGQIQVPDGAAGRSCTCPYCKVAMNVPGQKVDLVESPSSSVGTLIPPVQSSGVLTKPMKSCPFCAELILAGAKKCRYCNEILDDDLKLQVMNPAISVPQPVIQIFNNNTNENQATSFAEAQAHVRIPVRRTQQGWGFFQTCGCVVACVILAFFVIGIIGASLTPATKSEREKANRPK